MLLFCGSSLIAWAQQDATPPASPDVIQQIRVIGNRRIPRETVLARLFTHVGDVYDPATIERDFNSLWNTGYFENLQIVREDTPKGIILDVVVKEKPTIREINYKGLNSVSQSDVLDRFKKEHLTGFSPESPYDPTKLARAIDIIRALLAEHGHQFATVKPDIRNIPPSSVAINFNIKEGPTVKVGNITFTGNHAMPSRDLRAAMKNLRPVGIPHSIILENLFARTYDASKLEEDTERVRRAMQDKGYFRASVGDPVTHIRNEGGLSFLTFRPRTGKRIDIRIPVDEGERYRLGGVTFTGNAHVQNVKALRSQFPTKDGEYFNATAIGKGLENLRKAYGSLGYINFTAVPTPRIDDAKHLVYLDIDIDEGKAFTVSRIEFQGNTITRDRVIRRELLIEEGSPYNSNLWEQSILRLNQLDYFDPLKVDQDSELHQDNENGTVSLLLKVHEKGKNSIGLNGGVSGLSGTFLGVNYSTNNFLGLGETLSLQGNLGNLARSAVFAFTEPYLRNKPISLGFQLFSRKTDYNSARNYAAVTGQAANLTAAQQSLTQNYNQSATGLNFSISYPLRHAFKRVGLTYSWDKSSITTFSQASANLFQLLAFRSGQIQGPNALEGIYTSSASLSYQYNKVGPTIFKPRFGSELSAAFQFAGIWGNVRYFSPVVQFKHYVAVKGLRPNPDGRNVFAFRVQGSYIQGFSGDVAPPFARFYSGGDFELRGFDVRSATPYAFIPVRANITLTNPDGTPVPIDPTNYTLGNIQIPIPIYRPVSVGGDVKFTSNLEYRIPLGGPVTFDIFDDFDITSVVRQSQLRQSVEGADELNSPLYGCTSYYNGACQGGQQIQFINEIRPISGTNVVPRDSVGAEIDVILPIVNAPFRLYYAYNVARLYEDRQGESLITRSMFPAGGAGDYTYNEAISAYDSLLHFREPRKTFRLSVSTTF
ncbi:MAG TPA: outer membrane protein assembly factor BamA [Acidobacteriaceae bacterium]|nr:outer membrane protein assembly factor BamA [Acidobacteriaceae bacterium]